MNWRWIALQPTQRWGGGDDQQGSFSSNNYPGSELKYILLLLKNKAQSNCPLIARIQCALLDIYSSVAKSKPVPAQTWLVWTRSPGMREHLRVCGWRNPMFPIQRMLYFCPDIAPLLPHFQHIGEGLLKQLSHILRDVVAAGTGLLGSPLDKLGTHGLSRSHTKHSQLSLGQQASFPVPSESRTETQLQLCRRKIFASTISPGFALS